MVLKLFSLFVLSTIVASRSSKFVSTSSPAQDHLTLSQGMLPKSMLDSNASLHVFVDASEKVYGCGIYLVTDNASCLLFGKSKVGPPAAPTLARLELQAVCLA
eukprot:scpid108951/ scgid35129/ 